LRASYLAAQQGSYELYIDLLMRLHEQSPGAGHDALALRASERARARALLDSLVEAGADIRQGVDPKLLERERSLQKQLNASQERRMRLLSGKHTPEQAEAADREVDSLLAQYQQAQAHIRATSPRYAALTQPQPLDLKGIQSQLDDETLLLVYRLGGKRSFLWAVTPTTVKSYVLAARSEIEKYSNWVRDSLKISNQPQSIAQAEEAIRQLSRLALSPVAGQLARKRLVIVADGALQYIPFAALVAPHSTRPLIFDHEIVNLPSVSALGQQRRELAGRATAPKTLAVIADPVFDLQDERFKTLASGRVESIPQNHTDPLRAVTRSARETGLMGFRRLRFSRQEADRIAGFFPSATYSKLVDFEASRANIFQTDLSQYRILHFATHGLFNNKSPELSGIVLSLYDTERRPQDGFLRAHELYNLRIGADLVVVSACQTALGKEVRGEGLIGLTRGFMYAGAPRIVVSLWNIDDEATAELMKRFYEVMARENLRPAAALRAAQASMSKEPRWSAPYYWAGFILQGEWR
jgi:CHAT domain-containing protein